MNGPAAGRRPLCAPDGPGVTIVNHKDDVGDDVSFKARQHPNTSVIADRRRRGLCIVDAFSDIPVPVPVDLLPLMYVYVPGTGTVTVQDLASDAEARECIAAVYSA